MQAALELGRGVVNPPFARKTIIKNTRQAAEYFSARVRGLPDEHFRVAYLNRQGRLLDDGLIALGTVDTVRPPIRSIVSRTLQTNASALSRHTTTDPARPSRASPTVLTREPRPPCAIRWGSNSSRTSLSLRAATSASRTPASWTSLALETLTPLPAKG